jgi:excisionase family DNA binding protein
MTPDADRLDRDPASPMAAGPLLTAEQLAERWQVPTGHVYRLTRERKIPVVKLGRYYRYRVDAIERFETGDLVQESAAA